MLPTFRRRAVRVPLGLDQAYWVEDADFDLDYHLRHIALPAPGDWRQFCTQLARLHSRPLDLTRPPWECTMIEGLDAIEGLPSGCFALAMKIHHAAIDGMAGVEMVNVMHDLAPDAVPAEVPDDWRPDPMPPQWSLLGRANVHDVTRPLSALRLAVANAAPMIRELPARRRQRGSRLVVPRIRSNDRVTAHTRCSTRCASRWRT